MDEQDEQYFQSKPINPPIRQSINTSIDPKIIAGLNIIHGDKYTPLPSEKKVEFAQTPIK